MPIANCTSIMIEAIEGYRGIGGGREGVERVSVFWR